MAVWTPVLLRTVVLSFAIGILAQCGRLGTMVPDGLGDQQKREVLDSRPQGPGDGTRPDVGILDAGLEGGDIAPQDAFDGCRGLDCLDFAGADLLDGNSQNPGDAISDFPPKLDGKDQSEDSSTDCSPEVTVDAGGDQEVIWSCETDPLACDDGDPSSQDSCVAGVCVHCTPNCGCSECGPDGCGGSCGECLVSNLCAIPECVDGLCVDVCDGGTIATGCCSNDSDCDDGDPCTQHICLDCKCLDAPVPYACCSDDADCPPKDDCEFTHCDPFARHCYSTPKSMAEQMAEGLRCCSDLQDCGEGGLWEEDSDGDGQPGPDNPGTLDICLAGQCAHIDFATGCDCEFDSDCPDDGLPCTVEVCRHSCLCDSTLAEGCCKSAADCEDGNACTSESCVNGYCHYEQTTCCCEVDADCDDGIICTADVCFVGCCLHYQNPYMPKCCVSDVDCEDCNALTVDICDEYLAMCLHF